MFWPCSFVFVQGYKNSFRLPMVAVCSFSSYTDYLLTGVIDKVLLFLLLSEIDIIVKNEFCYSLPIGVGHILQNTVVLTLVMSL